MNPSKSKNQNSNKITDPSRIITLANFISILRALLAIPIIYSMANPDWNWITGALILLAALSDALDGYVARKAKAVTHFGKWIDPVADFVVIIAVLVYLVGINKFPSWFFYYYLIRHVVIASFAIYCMNYEYMILHSNWWGKWSVNITALGIFFIFLNFSFTMVKNDIYLCRLYFTNNKFLHLYKRIYYIN